MSWTLLRDAFQAGLARASGLPPERVVWKYQNASAPQMSYLAVSLGVELTVGQDWAELSLDLARPNGQEYERRVLGVREVALELEAFSGATAGDGDAHDIARRTLAALTLPDVRLAFTRAGISPFDPGPVTPIPDVVGVGFRGRAAATVRCYVPAPDVREYIGYIAKVSGTVTVSGTHDGVPRVLPFVAPE